jgi:NAD(P)-dependent dehydrogenase (short-subunit alcohol dehydrogenase family)
MSRIFITGSADGLGRMAAELLIADGHQVVLHARNERRAHDAEAAVPKAEAVVVGDLTTIAATKQLASKVNELGGFDAIIHNAAVGYQEPRRINTDDNLPHVFAVNSLAPFILTALIKRPKRLVYLSSGLHRDGNASLRDLLWTERAWNGTQAYCDSKLHDVLLAFAVARRWPNTLSNSLEPGWVATKMGGQSAPDDLSLAPKTQVWLAASDDPKAKVTASYFYHGKQREVHPMAKSEKVQDDFIATCERISGVRLPA